MSKLNTKKVYPALVFLSILLVIMVLMHGMQPKYDEKNISVQAAPIYHEDGTITLPLNAIAYGICKPETKEVVNSGEILIPIDEKLNVIMDVQQNMTEPKEYSLIVLVNNEQREYEINHEKFLSYPFLLDETGHISFDVTVETDKNKDKEILFVLFEQPNYTDSDSDVFAVTDFSRAFSCRHFLYTDRNKTQLEYSSDAQLIDFDSRVLNLFLSDDPEELNILAVTESGQGIDAILSNPNDTEMTYALGSFLDWRQYPFPDGDTVKYILVPPLSTMIFHMTAPEVMQNTPYQVYAVPHGYLTGGSAELKGNIGLISSLRTVIVPQN